MTAKSITYDEFSQDCIDGKCVHSVAIVYDTGNKTVRIMSAETIRKLYKQSHLKVPAHFKDKSKPKKKKAALEEKKKKSEVPKTIVKKKPQAADKVAKKQKS